MSEAVAIKGRGPAPWFLAVVGVGVLVAGGSVLAAHRKRGGRLPSILAGAVSGAVIAPCAYVGAAQLGAVSGEGGLGAVVILPPVGAVAGGTLAGVMKARPLVSLALAGAAAAAVKFNESRRRR